MGSKGCDEADSDNVKGYGIDTGLSLMQTDSIV